MFVKSKEITLILGLTVQSCCLSHLVIKVAAISRSVKQLRHNVDDQKDIRTTGERRECLWHKCIKALQRLIDAMYGSPLKHGWMCDILHSLSRQA